MPYWRNQSAKKAFLCSRNGFCCTFATDSHKSTRFASDGIGTNEQEKMDENNLNNGLDDLLNMFKKLMESQDLDAIPGINEEQKEQLKMFLDDFDELKDDMKIEIYKLDPFTKQMVGMVMGQLKNFPGDMQHVGNTGTAPVEPTVNKEKQLTDIPGTTENLEAQLAKIDQQLRNSELSDDDINRLLDERSLIIADLKVES